MRPSEPTSARELPADYRRAVAYYNKMTAAFVAGTAEEWQYSDAVAGMHRAAIRLADAAEAKERRRKG